MSTVAISEPVATDTKPMEETKPVFTKVDKLKPGTKNHTLIVKVVSSKTVLQDSRTTPIAEFHIGDDTGCILFTARHDQIDMMKPGATVILHNAKIDLFEDTMRVAVDECGRIEATETANFAVKENNNRSLIQYEVVNVVSSWEDEIFGW